MFSEVAGLIKSPDVENTIPGGDGDGDVTQAFGLAGQTDGGMSFLLGVAKVVAEIFQTLLLEITDFGQLFLPAENTNPAGSTVCDTALKRNRSSNTSRVDRLIVSLILTGRHGDILSMDGLETG